MKNLNLSIYRYRLSEVRFTRNQLPFLVPNVIPVTYLCRFIHIHCCVSDVRYYKFHHCILVNFRIFPIPEGVFIHTDECHSRTLVVCTVKPNIVQIYLWLMQSTKPYLFIGFKQLKSFKIFFLRPFQSSFSFCHNFNLATLSPDSPERWGGGHGRDLSLIKRKRSRD